MINDNALGLINFKNYYLKPVAYYSRKWERFDMPFHSHPYYELMYVEDGECKIEINTISDKQNIKTDTFYLTKDMVVFFNSNINHKLIVSNSAQILHLEFERCRIVDIKKAICFYNIINDTHLLKKMLVKNQLYYVLKNAHDIISTIKRIHIELQENIVLKNKNFFIVQAYIIELFIKIARVYNENYYLGGITYIKRAIEYIRNNYTEQISVDMISSLLGISNGYLHKLMKDETGKTIIEIINNYRIEKAKHLINSTIFPLIDISIECGFNNRQNFYHAFKNLVGMSPQEYRRGKGFNNLYHFEKEYINF